MRIGWQFVVDSCRLFYHILVLCRLHIFGTKFDPKVLMSIALKKQKVKQTSLELKDQCWYNLRHFSCPYTNVVLMLSTLTKSNAQLAELPFKFSCGILSIVAYNSWLCATNIAISLFLEKCLQCNIAQSKFSDARRHLSNKVTKRFEISISHKH